MSRRRTLVASTTLALTAVAVFGFLALRDPERRGLDEEGRRAAPGQFVRLDDGVTHFDVAGPDSGARVVLVHGFSVPSYIWDSTSTALAAAGFRVARYDVFGRGWSDRPDAAYSFDLYDRQLQQLLDSLGWRTPVHLVGLSMGGPVVATFAGRHLERVRSLTLIDPASGASPTLPAMFRLPLIGPLLWQGLAVPGMADNQRTDFVEPAKWPDWPERYRVQQQFRGFGRALRSALREAERVSFDSIFARAGETGVPTLLIWGTEDATVPIANAEGVRKAIPQARFHRIEGAGHLPHMERSGVVNPLLISFLDSTGGAARDSLPSPR